MNRVVGTPGRDQSGQLATALTLADQYSRELTEFTLTFLGSNGVANRDMQLLLAIDGNPGIHPSALADQLHVSRALVSQALRRFDTAHLVTRITESTDRRSRGLRMTPSGYAMLRSYESALSQWFTHERPLVAELHALLRHSITALPAHDLAPLDVIAQLATVGAAYRRELQPLLLPFGRVTVTQRRVLNMLDAFGPQRPVQLASRLSLTTGGISIALDALEDASLILRRPASSGGDKKAVHVGLTARGAQATAATQAVFLRHSGEILDALALTTWVRSPAREHQVATDSAS